MGAAPIRDSVPRYHSRAFPEGARILAPPVLGSATILQIVAARGHRGMYACRGQFRIDQSSQSEMSRLKFISDCVTEQSPNCELAAIWALPAAELKIEN